MKILMACAGHGEVYLSHVSSGLSENLKVRRSDPSFGMRVSTLIQRLRIVNLNKVRGVSLGEGRMGLYTGCPKKKFLTKNAHFKGFRVILEQNVRE